ncbi:MAG TPA: uroporphyrinogen-III synthase [Anaeromyxobacteraceae bacterium]|nr:uroporphyrinogen-III synthase [Anaeromyxobacteraceae bacterium]
MTLVSRLDGRRVAVTRGKQAEDALAERLRALGAELLEFPAIAVAPPEAAAQGVADAVLRRLQDFEWAVFASGNAVEQTLLRLGALGLGPEALARLRLAAVGPATAEKLAGAVRAPDLVPAEARGAALAEALAPHVRGRRVLVPRAEEGRPELVDGLQAAGAQVVAPVVYRTVPAPPESLRPLGDALERGEVDAVAFMSPSAVKSVVAALGPRASLLGRTVVAVIGPTTAEAAATSGVRVDVQPSAARGEALAQAIAERLGKRGG